ncbi:MAG TPA: glycosyl hydrolase [Bacteroidales bacterium]|nr:glycosyl hydrolase [Bacteroidales bacterium]
MKLFLQVIFVLIFQMLLSGCDGKISKEFTDPPLEFSVMPFWFWNDTLKDEEILRQISDFEEHGVYGFVIHPRIGLPDNVTWLSENMIHSMRLAIDEARRRGMYVILYDEGMYPSGSSSGQVVARNPKHAARGLAKIDLKRGERVFLKPGQDLITVNDRAGGGRVAIIDLPSEGVIRGLHYIGEGTESINEELPAAADILNPDAVTSFMELVYEKYAAEFGEYFGETITGIFTDEPSILGRNSIAGIKPGSKKLISQINEITGYDITPFLADLWYNDSPDATTHRLDYNRAINICLEENYYKRLSDWCSKHGVTLMGHPAGSMDIGAEQFFQIPGQDLVWRYVEPGSKALEGEHSTMAKCASSAMIHLGLRRNSNELYGAYGHNLTYDEMSWLANWCFVRGQNLLFPHAFYYSIRGPRFDERPPDVGPNSNWWDKYKTYADACRRLSWINTDSKLVCDIAILCEADWLPYKSAKTLFQKQRDFNYLEIRHLLKDCIIDEMGIHISGMTYKTLIIDSISSLQPEIISRLKILERNGQLMINADSWTAGNFSKALIYKNLDEFISEINRLSPADLQISPASENIRYRHVIKGDSHYYILFNEEDREEIFKINTSIKGRYQWLDPYTAESSEMNPDNEVFFKPHELKILRIF